MIEFKPGDVRAFIDEREVPHAVACFIQYELVCRPVHARGTPQQVYENAALHRWVDRGASNPVTRERLSRHDILPAPQVHAAASRFRRLVSVECRRRAELPELPPECAQNYMQLAALHTIARHRNDALRPAVTTPPAADEAAEGPYNAWRHQLMLSYQFLDFQTASLAHGDGHFARTLGDLRAPLLREREMLRRTERLLGA